MLWCSGECVILPCFNAQPYIFAVMNGCVVVLSVFSSDILTWSADSAITQNKESVCGRICNGARPLHARKID